MKEYTDDLTIQMNLISLTMLLHNGEVYEPSTVIGQPPVIHRPLSISFIKEQNFLKSMQNKGHDFNEEMHAIIYETYTADGPVDYRRRLKQGDAYLPVSSVYTTDERIGEGEPLVGCLAIYPTIDGLQSFTDTMGITMEVTDNSFDTIRKLLLSIDFKSLFCDEILYHDLQNVHGARTCVNNNTTTIIQQKYKDKKNTYKRNNLYVLLF
jgi:hypothetical protein